MSPITTAKTTAADSSGGGVPGVSGTFDDTRVAGTSVAEWLDMLLAGDPEFGDLLKVLADFSPVVDRDDASTRALC